MTAVDEEVKKWRENNVILFASMNKRFRFFIPSKDNYFGGVPVEYVMIDSGCNSILLPLPESLEFLEKTFVEPQYSWRIRTGKGVSGSSLCLYITAVIGKIQVSIHGKAVAEVDRLRFHLSSEDVKNLSACSALDITQKDLIVQFFQTHVVSRRKHALLGQDILRFHLCVQTRDCFIVLNPTCDSIPVSVRYLNALLVQESVKSTNAWTKEFEDLEDDDHDGDDEMQFIDDPIDD